MEIEKTLISFTDFDHGHFYRVDTIYYRDTWWLVGTWRQYRDARGKVPELLIRLDQFAFQEVNAHDHRFVLNNAIPRDVLLGKTKQGYEVEVFPAPFENPGGTQ